MGQTLSAYERRQRLKITLTEQGLDKAVSFARWQNYLGNSSPMDNFVSKHGYEAYKVGIALDRSRYGRRKRAKQKVGSIVDNPYGVAYFLTLTFNDEALARTSEQYRRTAVARFLKSFSPCYMANVDYGKDNGREHYHAVALLPDGKIIPTLSWARKFGFMLAKKVRLNEKSVAKVAEYTAKLTAHAFKVGNGNPPRMIYSRNSKDALRRFFIDPPF